MRTKILRKKWRKWSRYSDRNFEHDYILIKYSSRYLVIDKPDLLESFCYLLIAICIALAVSYG